MELFIYWDPSPDFVSFGAFAIKWYGVFWGLSLLSCFYIGRYLLKQLHRDEEKLTILIQYIFIGGLIGARLAHVVFYQLDYYLAHPAEIIAVWKGGLASHGGVAGGIIGLYFFCKRNKEFNFFWALDIGAATVVALAALIRIGNLMNSELYGKPTDVPWAFIFEQVDNTPRHPVVLYESIAYFFIQILMLQLFKKYKDTQPGLYLSFFLLTVFGVRLILEFYKEPDGAMIFNFISKTQLLNVPFILTGLILAYLVMNKKLSYAPSVNG